MFFATQIKSLGNGGGAIDMQGRKLIFIGYLPVQVGDWVYTDGNVIFGNAPPKGSPQIFDVPKGVPVLGDIYLLSSEQESLRGYFTRNGKYKRYDVAIDDWIVNSDKKFLHGSDNFDESKITDADVTQDGKQIIATKGVYWKSEELSTTNVKVFINDSHVWGSNKNQRWEFSIQNPRVYEQILGDKELWQELNYEENKAHIFIDNQQSGTLDLKLYADDVETKALLCAEEFMKQSYEDVPEPVIQSMLGYPGDSSYISLTRFTKRYPAANTVHGNIDSPALPRPSEPFIAYTIAYIMTCNVNDTGFAGTVFASTYGYCFPHIQPRFIEDFEFIDEENGDEENGLKYITYWIKEWNCVPFGYSCLYKIENEIEEDNIIACRDYGGLDTNIIASDGRTQFANNVGGSWADYTTKHLRIRHIELTTDFETQDWEELLSVGEGFYTMDKFGLLTFFNSKRNKVADNIPVHDDLIHVEITHGEFADTNLIQFANTPQLNYNVYTPDGNVEEKLMGFDEYTYTIIVRDENGNIIETQQSPESDSEKIPPLDGYYIKKDENTFEPLQFTPLFYEFKDGSYLYGIRGGKLYFKSKDGEQVEVADGVKNFRLRELKNMSKAKR